MTQDGLMMKAVALLNPKNKKVIPLDKLIKDIYIIVDFKLFRRLSYGNNV